MNDLSNVRHLGAPVSIRNWELASLRAPLAHEEPLVTLARVIDPDAWRLHPMHFRRAKSLEAAKRVQEHYAAWQAVQEALKPRRRKIPFSSIIERIFP